MSIQRVKEYFKTLGIEDRILEFDCSSATVDLAAAALGVEGARIAKTLSFKKGDSCILIVTAGDGRIDNKKFKAQFGMKANMSSAQEVLDLVGHAVGGVCPFGINDSISVYLDSSLKRFETVFPACGSSNSAVEMTCLELYEYAGGKDWVDVCKDWII